MIDPPKFCRKCGRALVPDVIPAHTEYDTATGAPIPIPEQIRELRCPKYKRHGGHSSWFFGVITDQWLEKLA